MEATPPPPPRDNPDALAAEPEQIRQNIEAVLDFYAREEQKLSRSQRVLERISLFIGEPLFAGSILLFVALWIIVNLVLRKHGMGEFDPPPFFWLQGTIGLGALLTATVVVIRQNRLEKLAEQRAHLDLKVTLLTEQKAAKIIDMLEELRRDLPNVKDRHDPEAAVLQQAMNPDQVIATLDEPKDADARGQTADESKPAKRKD
jgi:uncharacterized membrane protein